MSGAAALAIDRFEALALVVDVLTVSERITMLRKLYSEQTNPMRSFIAPAIAIAFALSLSGCAAMRDTPVVAAPTIPSAQPAALVRGRIIIAGQPNEDDLRAWRDQGVGAIFNVRTDEEMDNRSTVPFDEAARAADLGYTYAQHPLGGSAHPYSPELLAQFAATVQASSTPILLHCGSGSRAGLLYAAYAVKYLGKSPDAAMRDLEPLGLWPLPLEKLTGIPLQLEAQ